MGSYVSFAKRIFSDLFDICQKSYSPEKINLPKITRLLLGYKSALKNIQVGLHFGRNFVDRPVSDYSSRCSLSYIFITVDLHSSNNLVVFRKMIFPQNKISAKWIHIALLHLCNYVTYGNESLADASVLYTLILILELWVIVALLWVTPLFYVHSLPVLNENAFDPRTPADLRATAYTWVV